jgi:hypothetical protein
MMGMGFPGPFGQQQHQHQHQHQPGMPPLPFPPAGMPFPYGAPPGSLPHMPPGMMGMGTYTLPPHLRHNNTIQPVATATTATTRPPPTRPTSSLFLCVVALLRPCAQCCP